MHATFVTLGQLFKFAFDATGILPRKHSKEDGLSFSEVRRLSKQIERLTKEEGDINRNSGKLIKSLAFELTGTIPNFKVNMAIGETLLDLFEVYSSVVRNEATFLSQKESVRWFCKTHAIQRLVVSIVKHTMHFNISREEFFAPEEIDWYLPTLSEDGIIWPLQKVIEWIYSKCQTNRTQFHIPEDVNRSTNPELRKNYENAYKWATEKTFPSWHGLHKNFSDSIDNLNNARESYHRSISTKEKESYLYILFIARLSTSIGKQLNETYGSDFLMEMATLFKKHKDWLDIDTSTFKQQVKSHIENIQKSEEERNKIWWYAAQDYWSMFKDRAEICSNTMDQIYRKNDFKIPESYINPLINQFGYHSVLTIRDYLVKAEELVYPSEFPQALMRGLGLAKRASNLEEIDEYNDYIESFGLNFSLEWIVHWNRSVFYYRRNDFKDSFNHIQKAFQLAKYAAGTNQYELVNSYIELSAKIDSWKTFKKGISWATYLGFKVRWLRDDEQTEENLRSVFERMKLVKY